MATALADSGESMDRTIGRTVHQLMWDRKIKQREVAETLGIQQSALSRKLRGERGWATDELVLVARALGVTVAYLFGEPTEPMPEPELPHLDSNQEPAGYPQRHLQLLPCVA